MEEISRIALARQIAGLYRRGRKFIDRSLCEQDFSSGQYGYLFYLFDHEGATQEEIRRALAYDKGTTARSLAKLEKSGFILRKSDGKDKRINHVFLTDRGREIHDDLVRISGEWNARLLQGFDEKEIELLGQMFERLLQNAARYSIMKKGNCYEE